MPDLRVTENGEERVVAVGDEPLTIGRDRDNALVLSEVRASRCHGVITPCPQGHRIRDLGSSNGTYVNERRVGESVLRAGDVIRIGDVEMKFEIPLPAARPPLTRRRPVRGVPFLIAPVVLLVLGALGLSAVGSRRDDEVSEARESLARYRLDGILLETDLDTKVGALEEYLREHGESREALRARSELTLAGERRDHRMRAEAAFTAVGAGSGSLSADELSYRYETLLRRFRDVPGIEARATARIREIARRSKAEAEQALKGVVGRLDGLLAKGDFAGAVAGLDRFYNLHPRLDDSLRDAARGEMSRVLDRAEGAFRGLEAQVDALRGEGELDEAETLLRTAMGNYTGTRFSTRVRMKFESLRAARRPAGPSETPVSARAEPGAVRPHENIFLRVQEAEAMARAGMLSRALQRFRQILPACKDPAIRAEIAGRIDDIERTQGLLTRLRETARDEPGRLGMVRLGGLRGRVTGADDIFLRFEVRGATIQRRWAELDLAHIVTLVLKLALEPDDLLSLAVLRFDRNDREGWIDTLVEAMEHAELKDAIDVLFARKEGLSVPRGGFVSHRGRILSQAEYEREHHEEAISDRLQKIADGLSRLDELPNFKGVARLRRRHEKLVAARKFALDLIYDEKRYFYPYRHRMAEYTPVQREVSDRVAAVRKIWDDSARIALQRSPEAATLVEKLETIAADLRTTYRYDTRPLLAALARRTLYMPVEPRHVTVRTFPTTIDHDRRIAYDQRVLDYNANLGGEAETTEIQQIRITNEYRLMMGRPAIVRDDRLVLAARGHSQEMAREGYFGHFSPHPERRDPMKRVRLEGYKGMPVSENCHKGSGSPQGAHDGWCRSSGHHRNLLQPFWTDMGAGRSGRLWTQNFGRTKRLSEVKKKEDSGPR